MWRATPGWAILAAGYGLIGLHLLLIIGGALLAVALDSQGAEVRDLVDRVVVLGMSSLGLVPLLALCLLILGELLRRGSIRAATPADRGAGSQGVNTTAFTPLGVLWHAFWVVLAVALVVLLVAGGRSGGPVGRVDEDLGGLWLMNGVFAAGIAAVCVGSLVKKLATAVLRPRWLARRPAAHPSAFWRSFTYRWRFDLWITGIGGFAVGAAAAIGEPGETTAAIVLGTGAATFVLGVVLSTQYFRSGEPLGSGESL